MCVGFALMAVSCNNDDDKVLVPQSKDLQAVDQIFFEQIAKTNAVTKKNEVWSGFALDAFPKYILYSEKDKSGHRGFLLDPTKKMSGAVAIDPLNAKGLKNVYRYDAAGDKLKSKLTKDNDTFVFFLGIENVNHYAQVYNTEKMALKDGNSIQFLVHEVFHLHQEDWATSSKPLQDMDNYPLTIELLPLQMMHEQIAKNLPKEKDLAKIDEYLAMYVAIRSKEIELDPSAQKLVKNMANWQENFEGTAKYVEKMVLKEAFGNEDSVFGTMDSKDILHRETLRVHYAWGIWYDTGAAVAYMLKKKGINVEAQLKAGVSLYALASKALKLSSTEKEQMLQKAKQKYDWPALVQESKRLLALK